MKPQTLQYGHAQQLNLAGSKSVAGTFVPLRVPYINIEMAEPSCPCFFTIEVIKRLEKYVDENQEAIKGGAWVEGQGWDQTLWDVEEFPTAVG